MLENQEILTQELTIHAKQRPTGFQCLIDALESTDIEGGEYYGCAYVKLFGDEENYTDSENWDLANDGAEETLSQLPKVDSILTPLEDLCLDMHSGEPLDEQGKELLALCKEIQKGVQV